MLSKLFGKFKKSKSVQLHPTYAKMRGKFLALKPGEVNLKPSPENPNVWGVLMEMHYQGAGGPILLVSIIDGTTSLYYSNGGGLVGLIKFPDVVQASKTFVQEAESHFKNLAPTTSFPLPNEMGVRFFILTFSGVFTAEATQNELSQNSHNLAPLYGRGQDVITQIRLTGSI